MASAAGPEIAIVAFSTAGTPPRVQLDSWGLRSESGMPGELKPLHGDVEVWCPAERDVVELISSVF